MAAWCGDLALSSERNDMATFEDGGESGIRAPLTIEGLKKDQEGLLH